MCSGEEKRGKVRPRNFEVRSARCACKIRFNSGVGDQPLIVLKARTASYLFFRARAANNYKQLDFSTSV